MLKMQRIFLLLVIGNLYTLAVFSQLITGYWKGKIDRKNVEVKIIKNGDSLTGTSYYYESANSYRRYLIRGYFDSRDNSVVWWDDILLEEKGNKKSPPAKREYISNADFNCPGGNKMYLDGKASPKDNAEKTNLPVALEKFNGPVFRDEWDYIIDNYTAGANDPELIDSIGMIALNKTIPLPTVIPVATASGPAATTLPKKEIPSTVSRKAPAAKPLPLPAKDPVAIVPLTNEEKFARRSKKLVQEITISGDSVELRFYDNAEVDGDSIAIFLNNILLYEHVLLSDKPYIIKLAVAALQPTNELVMVAENLGSIPPNTSLMVADIEGKTYEARLESTEQSSAVIRFVKSSPATQQE